MDTKQFKGKAIYNPSGRAGEYSPWACNFYTGCSNDCAYCYLKRGVLRSTWSDAPKLKKKFRDEDHALAVFKKELFENIEQLRRHGLFFTFTSDPLLDLTMDLTVMAVQFAVQNGVPVILLTKRADNALFIFDEDHQVGREMQSYKDRIAIGFTLTGRDDKEPGASTNQDRIIAMAQLHAAGYKTWASIEPIVDLGRSYEMIVKTVEFCDHYKVGLQSGCAYNPQKVWEFVHYVGMLERNRPIYLKDSIFKYCPYPREEVEQTTGNFVGVDYNIFANH
jgi:DNA repair photolyase